MSFIIEAVAEICFSITLDASIQASTEKKYKLWQRILAILFLGICFLFYAFILIGVTSVGVIALKEGELAPGVSMLAVATLILVGIFVYSRRTLKVIQKKRAN